MILRSEEEVITLVKKHSEAPLWITEARKDHKMYKALVYGDGFLEELIQQIEKIESADRAYARKKYSKDIRDLFSRVYEPRSNVFSSHGGSDELDIKSNQLKDKVISVLSEFKGNKSIKKYLSEYFFQLLDVDPNGIIFMEYFKDVKIEPTYKSINDIRYYESNGQNLGVLIFEPKQVVKGGMNFFKWRVVDDLNDWTIIQNGTSYAVSKDDTFKHPFGNVPAVILSNYQKLGTELRLSPVFPIQELAKDYARDKSILTLYKFINGFPIHWRYNQQCRVCAGTGKTGERDNCKKCDGKGILGKNDVTDILNLPFPKNEEPKIAPDLAGFVSPDLKTWEQYNKDLRASEQQMSNTIWGTEKATDKGNETATGRFIDVQPVMNKLNSFADNVEWVHNQLTKWVIKWVDKSNSKTDVHITYGRGFIIESPDVLLDRYTDNRVKGCSTSVLDKLLREYITSKYKNNRPALEIELKKIEIEPYIHLSTKEVKDIFGDEAAIEKYLFEQFWEEVDTNKPVFSLKEEFSKFVLNNKPISNQN